MVNPRVSMLADERYPMVVSPDEFPAVPQVPQPTSQPPPHVVNNVTTRSVPYGAEYVGVVSPVSSMTRSTLSRADTATNPFPVSPTMYNGDPTMFKGEGSWKTPVFDSELLRVPQEPSNSIWKQFNVWKVLFFAFMAFVTGVVITAVVLNNKTKSSSKTACAAAAPNTTTSALLSTTASVTSSGLFLQDGATWNMQVYYQPANSTKIIYKMDLEDSSELGYESFQAARNMTLSVLPKPGSPMTATASTDTSGVVYLDVFYITSSNSIAQAHIACPANSADCKTVSNMVISTGGQALHPNSSLAAVNVDKAENWRVYYQNTKHNIVELAGNSSGFNTGEIIYRGTTLTGSSLTAVNAYNPTNNINVFFVDHDSQALYYTQYTSSWQTAKPITTAVVQSWNPTSNLASAYASTPDWMRLYYVGTDSKVWEYIGYNASTTNMTWEAQPGTSPAWLASADSTQDITATAFNDQVRWWQYGTPGLLESALDNTTWTTNRVL